MPTDMGIRDGTFTVLFGDVEVETGGGVPDVERVGGMVVGGTDGPDAVGGPVIWGG